MSQTITTAKALQIGSVLLDVIREAHPRMEAQSAQIFIAIARHDGISQSDLEKVSGLTKGSVGRNTDLLGAGSARTEGLGLVRRYEDPKDRRVKRFELTDSGRDLSAKMTSAIDALF